MKKRQLWILAAATLVLTLGIVFLVSAQKGTASPSAATVAQSGGSSATMSHDCSCDGKAGCAEKCKNCPSFKDANGDGRCDQCPDCGNHQDCKDACAQTCQGKCEGHTDGGRHR
jgi:hypothetical protein